MKLPISTSLSALLVLSLATTGCESMGLQKSSEPATMPSPEEMMAKMEELGTPDENHRRLEPIVGDFRYELTMWMAPGEPPTKSDGTSSNRWSLGNLFVESTIRGTFMEKPFEGRSFLGYDKSAKEYAAIWIDSGTSIVWPISHGKASADGKTITLTRDEYYDPMLGGNAASRDVLVIHDRDHHVFESYMTASGQDEMKVMEISYSRIR